MSKKRLSKKDEHIFGITKETSTPSETSIRSGGDGADDDLTKPFSARELVAQISSQIGKVQARRTIAESEERFRALVEASAQIVWTASADGEVVEDSPSWRAYTGQTYEQLRGWGWLDALHHEDREHTAGLWRRAIAEKSIFNTEHRVRHVSGEWLWTEVRAVPILNSDGSLQGWVGMNTDITERKRAESAMAQMVAIVESSDDAIISKDLNGIIVSWNKGAERLFGYTAAEAIGKPVAILIPPDRMEEEPRILERIRRGEHVDHYETARRRKDGLEIDISLTISPIRNKTGKVIGASKIARDITERKRAESEVRAAYEKESAARAEAEAANRSKDEFLALVSHELRSPLNAILGYNQMLLENPHDEARLKLSCDVIERNARTQLQLIEDLLDVARIVSGKLRLEMRALDVTPVLAHALDVVRPAAAAKDVQLRMADCGWRVEDGATQEESAISSSRGPQPTIVLGDAARLQQIVWNLLSNAIKFTPAGGCVELRTELTEERIRIIVSDTGRGIQPEFLPHIFDRFRQADSSNSQRYSGLGLGLALVRHLVELHRGAVEAASDGVGCGATFTVTLPLATQSELANAEPPALAPPAASTDGEEWTDDGVPAPDGLTIEGLRVLVVDDQEDARVSLADFLNRCGAVVTTVSSGAEALAIISNPPDGARPDILICDIAMPDEDGYAALRRMRALEKARGVVASQRIPAVALTALSGSEERLRALSAGFQLHVAKPVDPVELMVVIANVTRLWSRDATSN